MEKKRVQLVGLAAVVALLLGGIFLMTRSHRSGDSTTASQGGGSAGTPSHGTPNSGSPTNGTPSANGGDIHVFQKTSDQPGSVTALNSGANGQANVTPAGGSAGNTGSVAGSAGVTPSGNSVGAVAVNGASLPGGTAPLAAVPVATPVPDACYTVTYHHKAVSGHTDEEACSHHKNLIQFKHENVNPKNVCVRVNGTPVHFLSVKGHADQVLIGAVAGPKSKLTVSYCVGSAKCEVKEDCAVPKDEFMEAIGGTTADVSKDARLGQWDPSMPSDKEADVLAKLDGDVKRELETNDDLNGRSRRGDMFKDWLSDNEGPACGVRQAKN